MPKQDAQSHNPAHSPGGSSSGSGAAVADFHVPLALGTQTGGSVIRPGSFNGIHAMKPTLGLIQRDGVLMQSHTLDTVGVYGRSVEDLALISDTLSVFDASDSFSFAGRRADLAAACRLEAPAPRFAFLQTPAWPEADSGARDAMERVVDGLGVRCVLETLPSPFDRIVDFHTTVMAAEMVPYYGPLIDASPEKGQQHAEDTP